MTHEQRQTLRKLISDRLRELHQLPSDGLRHGFEDTYKRLGCRCDLCREASNAARRTRARNGSKPTLGVGSGNPSYLRMRTKEETT